MNSPEPRLRRRRTQVERREEAEDNLIEAAIHLLARKGFDRITLADVGVEAGYSRGLPIHYFGSKLALIRLVAQRLRDMTERQFQGIEPGLQGLDSIKRLVQHYFARPTAGRDPSKAILTLLIESLHEDSEIADISRSYVAFWTDFAKQRFDEAVALGQMPADTDTFLQSVLLVGALRGAMLQHMVDPAKFDLKDVGDALLANIELFRKSTKPESGSRENLRFRG